MEEVRPSTIQTENSMEFMTQAIGPLQCHSFLAGSLCMHVTQVLLEVLFEVLVLT